MVPAQYTVSVITKSKHLPVLFGFIDKKIFTSSNLT